MGSPLQLIIHGYELSLKYSQEERKEIPEENNKFKTVLSKIDDKALNKLANMGYIVIPLLKEELLKRKIVKELSQPEQSIEI